jgi:hypothetical protein
MHQITMLKQGGFNRVGCWSAVPGSDEMMLDAVAPKEPGVYVHVVNGSIMYVGSAQRGLSRRMNHYCRTKSMRTAYRIRQNILAALADGLVVEVYMLVPTPDELSYHGLPIDIIAGVEEGLIRAVRPLWNIRGLGA